MFIHYVQKLIIGSRNRYTTPPCLVESVKKGKIGLLYLLADMILYSSSFRRASKINWCATSIGTYLEV
jgi:hypothetical protein